MTFPPTHLDSVGRSTPMSPTVANNDRYRCRGLYGTEESGLLLSIFFFSLLVTMLIKCMHHDEDPLAAAAG